MKKYIEAGILCVIVLIAAAFSEFHSSPFSGDGQLERNAAGGNSRQVELVVNGSGLKENRSYTVTVEPEKATAEEAEAWFAEAETEIDHTVFGESADPDHVCTDLVLSDTYADGAVEAEWAFDDYTYVTTEGVLNSDDIPEEGVLVAASAELTCGAYSEIYEFSFCVFPAEMTGEERLLSEIENAIQKENEKEGSSELTLPKKIGSVRLTWSGKRSHLTVKILFLEILFMVLLYIAELENRRIRIRRRSEEMERDYPEIVSKLSILMGAGMSLKQAWKSIADQYVKNRKDRSGQEKAAYEEMVMTLREMADGESESTAYRKFGERIGAGSYYRLSRELIRNLQKGSAGLCDTLQKEAADAFEKRKLLARKRGEEAGTRMLMPLMLMMIIVIAIVMVPALLSFQM